MVGGAPGTGPGFPLWVVHHLPVLAIESTGSATAGRRDCPKALVASADLLRPAGNIGNRLVRSHPLAALRRMDLRSQIRNGALPCWAVNPRVRFPPSILFTNGPAYAGWFIEARAGIEPANTGFADQRITTLLPRRHLWRMAFIRPSPQIVNAPRRFAPRRKEGGNLSLAALGLRSIDPLRGPGQARSRTRR